MRVHLIKERTVENFIVKHAISKTSFRLWLSVIKTSDWETPENILATFGSADLLGNGSERVVFNIGGNNFRLIGKYDFAKTRVHLTIAGLVHMLNILSYVMQISNMKSGFTKIGLIWNH